MILTGDGIPIKSDLPHEETVNYAGLVTQFVKKAWDLVKKLPVPPRKDSSDDAGAADEEDHAQEQARGQGDTRSRPGRRRAPWLSLVGSGAAARSPITPLSPPRAISRSWRCYGFGRRNTR